MHIDDDTETGLTKRQFVKKAAYVVPAVLTLAAAPAFASAGSNAGRVRRRPTLVELQSNLTRSRAGDEN